MLMVGAVDFPILGTNGSQGKRETGGIMEFVEVEVVSN
jgi:hypothetical protein